MSELAIMPACLSPGGQNDTCSRTKSRCFGDLLPSWTWLPLTYPSQHTLIATIFLYSRIDGAYRLAGLLYSAKTGRKTASTLGSI